MNRTPPTGGPVEPSFLDPSPKAKLLPLSPTSHNLTAVSFCVVLHYLCPIGPQTSGRPGSPETEQEPKEGGTPDCEVWEP